MATKFDSIWKSHHNVWNKEHHVPRWPANKARDLDALSCFTCGGEERGNNLLVWGKSAPFRAMALGG